MWNWLKRVFGKKTEIQTKTQTEDVVTSRLVAALKENVRKEQSTEDTWSPVTQYLDPRKDLVEARTHPTSKIVFEDE